jgi:hypothetical protein
MSYFDEQVQAAVLAHSEWKQRLRLAISTGKSDFRVEVVHQDNQCGFGKWLYAEGATSFPSATAYEDVRRLHREFHEEAARVLSHAITGKPAEASRAMELGSPFSKVSAQLVTALTRARAAAA